MFALLSGLPLTAYGLTPHWRRRAMTICTFFLLLYVPLLHLLDIRLEALFIQTVPTILFPLAICINIIIAETLVGSKQYNPNRGCPCYGPENTCQHRATAPTIRRRVGRRIVGRRNFILFLAAAGTVIIAMLIRHGGAVIATQ